MRWLCIRCLKHAGIDLDTFDRGKWVAFNCGGGFIKALCWPCDVKWLKPLPEHQAESSGALVPGWAPGGGK